jgi:coenzyme F420-0:L-glutamate ligase/coenzyme F420-1:gamma-L-glutamate ligase
MSGLVLPPGRHGPGAVALVRPEAEDMFGLGAREAVLSALHADDPRGFGSPCSAVELVVQLSALAERTAQVRHEEGAVVARLGGTDREQGATDVRLRTAAFALGWRPEADVAAGADGEPVLRFRPVTP